MAFIPESEIRHIQSVAHQQHYSANGWQVDGPKTVNILTEIIHSMSGIVLQAPGLDNLLREALHAQYTAGVKDTIDYITNAPRFNEEYNPVEDLAKAKVLDGSEPDYVERMNHDGRNIKKYLSLQEDLSSKLGIIGRFIRLQRNREG